NECVHITAPQRPHDSLSLPLTPRNGYDGFNFLQFLKRDADHVVVETAADGLAFDVKSLGTDKPGRIGMGKLVKEFLGIKALPEELQVRLLDRTDTGEDQVCFF